MLPGGGEIWLICGVIVLLFGAAAIPKLARSIGKAKGEFEKGVKDGQADAKASTDAEEPDSDSDSDAKPAD